jgi:hypothetical protein
METCAHAMDLRWCYLCHVEESLADPRAVWGLDVWDAPEQPWERRTEPMTASQAGYLRFLCEEFGDRFDATLTEGEASVVVDSFLDEPMSDRQARTLMWLCEKSGAPMGQGLSYGQARAQIRKLVAIRGLRSA